MYRRSTVFTFLHILHGRALILHIQYTQGFVQSWLVTDDYVLYTEISEGINRVCRGLNVLKLLGHSYLLWKTEK
jgi:hypothetical protein